LHPQWQAWMIPKLKELLPNTTFYIATHSPLVLALLQEGEAYLLNRDESGVVRSELISAPNRKAFADVLENAFGINLNQIKRETLNSEDQSSAKQALLGLLRKSQSAKADT
jgi:predicted ATP-binding protein involved in virulence